MSNKILTIHPDSEEYQEVFNATDTKVNNPAERFDYNELADEYNSAAMGSILIMPDSSRLQSSNVIVVLNNRGIDNKVDFRANKAMRAADGTPLPAEERNILIRKLTEKPMRKVAGN